MGPFDRRATLGVWPGFRLPDLHGLAADVAPAPAIEQRISRTYYDATDLRLVRAGVTVRHVQDGPDGRPGRWRAEVPDPLDADVPLAVEVEGHRSTPPDSVVDLVRARLRTGELVAVTCLETARRVVTLADGEGRTAGAVADDEVSVVEGGRVAARFREVEVTVAGDGLGHLLAGVVERLRAAGAADADPAPELVRALGPRALAPPDPVVPVLEPDSTLADAVRAVVAGAVQRLSAYDPLVRLDAAPAGVHQARVAMRRLRSDLRTFARLVDPDWVASFADDLRWLAGELGRVRDADVLLARLQAAVEALAPSDAEAAEPVLAELRRQRNQALGDVQTELGRTRYLDLLDRLVAAGQAPVLQPEADQPAADGLPSLAQAPWRKLRKIVAGLPAEPTDDELHEVRIQAKRARYAAEAASALVPDARARAKAVAAVQEVLGDWHDAVVAAEWLRTTVGLETPPRQALAVGLLVAREEATAAGGREGWREAWRAAADHDRAQRRSATSPDNAGDGETRSPDQQPPKRARAEAEAEADAKAKEAKAKGARAKAKAAKAAKASDPAETKTGGSDKDTVKGEAAS